MEIVETEFDGLVILKPKSYEDTRGYFFELWNEQLSTQMGFDRGFVQDNVCFSRFLPNMTHQFLGSDRLNNSSVDTPIALQEPENNTFTSSPTSTLTFTSTAKVGFVQLYFSFESSSFQFTHVIDCFSQPLVDTSDCLVIDAQIPCQPIGWLLLIESCNNFQLSTKKMASFLSSTSIAFYITALCSTYLERTTIHTLFSAQKVVETTQNQVRLHNLIYLQFLIGYDLT